MIEVVKMYIAHIRSTDGKIQTVQQHLIETKEICEKIGNKIQMKHVAGLAGLLHDMGKFTTGFKNYIMQAVNDPDNAPIRGSIDHSTAGGRLLFEKYYNDNSINKIMVEIIGNGILSHHGYLQDYLNPNLELKFLTRIKDKELEDYNEAKMNFFLEVMSETEFENYVNLALNEINQFLKIIKEKNYSTPIMLLTKYIFSALIDADRTSTRCFEDNVSYNEHFTHHSFEKDYEKLLYKIDALNNNSVNITPINKLRQKMSDECDQVASKPSDVFTLSIPTGGGKTLSSLRYALKHAVKYNKKRIIYIVPYTTIIEQNAEVVRNLLSNTTTLLEHHSNVFSEKNNNFEDKIDEEVMTIENKLLLARDNWDAPVIFSTMVQFLNIFYSSGTRNIRRLHNLSESVIIFDEVQKVPVKCIALFNASVNFLNNYCDSSIVLCTATQPALKDVEHNLMIGKDTEMISRIDDVNEAFKRVEVCDIATSNQLSTAELADFIEKQTCEVRSQLVILNTKSVVKKLYHLLKDRLDDTKVYHLSTSMCASHRRDILKSVSKDLESNQPIICLSTQLIEAGVDISFQQVVRSLTGLDSIAQAAGRCNRHGECKFGRVYLIDHKEENLSRLPEIFIGKDITKKMLIDLSKDSNIYKGNILSRSAMEHFFREYYSELASEIDYTIPSLNVKMTDLLLTNRENNNWLMEFTNKFKTDYPLFSHGSYQTAAKYFNVIDSLTTSVIVPFKEGREIIADINGEKRIEDISILFKKAQHYSVNVHVNEFNLLRSAGAVIDYFEGKLFALAEGFYSEEVGLDILGESNLSDQII